VEKNEQVCHSCFPKEADERDPGARISGFRVDVGYFVDISAEKLSRSQQPIKGRNDFLPIFSLFATDR